MSGPSCAPCSVKRLVDAIALVQLVTDSLRNASDVGDPLQPEQAAQLGTVLGVALDVLGEVLDRECAR